MTAGWVNKPLSDRDLLKGHARCQVSLNAGLFSKQWHIGQEPSQLGRTLLKCSTKLKPTIVGGLGTYAKSHLN